MWGVGKVFEATVKTMIRGLENHAEVCCAMELHDASPIETQPLPVAPPKEVMEAISYYEN